jgi:hypothetical protein
MTKQSRRSPEPDAPPATMRKQGRKPDWRRPHRWHLMTLKGWTFAAIAASETDAGSKISRQGVADAVYRYRRAVNAVCPTCNRHYEDSNNE